MSKEVQYELMHRIAELESEIENYRQTIADAEGALDSAEKELNELLTELYQVDAQDLQVE